ncbi:MAG: DUF3883 domain-containing protein [Termitinemataceae bacterium]|nr:MAG: DUF3883 domain-containing protein [Termitinemataceae bacterium]
MTNNQRHRNYDILNLIGYGLSKFNMDFVHEYGFSTKSQFYEYIVKIGVADTVGTVKNRQDLFDGMTTDGPRKGWWQKGPIYKHRKDYIDSLFGNLNVTDYADIVKMSLIEMSVLLNIDTTKLSREKNVKASPIIKSQFKQMQKTGKEAEYYFMNNYMQIERFANAKIEDARLLGDGYDFQITVEAEYTLAEIKGIRNNKGAFRMTKNEYDKAAEYKNNYALIIISNLEEIPRMVPFFNPISNIDFEKRIVSSEQIYYQSAVNEWKEK